MWFEDVFATVFASNPSLSPSLSEMASYNELSLSAVEHRVCIADLTILHLEACCTESIHSKIQRIAVDANGYELFCHSVDGTGRSQYHKMGKRAYLQCCGSQMV